MISRSAADSYRNILFGLHSTFSMPGDTRTRMDDVGSFLRAAGRSQRDFPTRDFLHQMNVEGLLRTGCVSWESVPFAIALALIGRNEDNPNHTVCDAASAGGDTDSIAAMAGAIVGAIYGFDAWRKDLREGHDKHDKTQILAEGLLKATSG